MSSAAHASHPAAEPFCAGSSAPPLGASLVHALHDGHTDAIYILLPIWRAEFTLGFGALHALRALYTGKMAALQIPAGRLAERLRGRLVLVAGTLLQCWATLLPVCREASLGRTRGDE
ncbi:MAG: hypothetical protein RQ966_15570 [Acetobacteraceae bacterium]|nr:hypothetical protein [Acetobacteraceae bacterium]